MEMLQAGKGAVSTQECSRSLTRPAPAVDSSCVFKLPSVSSLVSSSGTGSTALVGQRSSKVWTPIGPFCTVRCRVISRVNIPHLCACGAAHGTQNGRTESPDMPTCLLLEGPPPHLLSGGGDLIGNKTLRHNLSLHVKVYTHDLTVIGGLLRSTTIDPLMKSSAFDCVSKHLQSRTSSEI